MSKKIKRVVGALLYDDNGKILLVTSGKWHGKHIVPGGEIEQGETEIDALHREIKEELGIEIEQIEKINESIKEPSEDFIDSSITFHFHDFIARARSKDITTNHEIDSYEWIDPDEALEKYELIPEIKKFIQNYINHNSKKIT